MEVKEFERYLELRNLKESPDWGKLENAYYQTMMIRADKGDRYEPFPLQGELYVLSNKLKNFIFEDQTAIENTILKMKITLNKLGSNSGYGSYNDSGKTLNDIKVVREILSILDMLENKKSAE